MSLSERVVDLFVLRGLVDGDMILREGLQSVIRRMGKPIVIPGRLEKGMVF